MADPRDAGATFRDVFAVPEFRALWVAQVLSLIGDQLARVALAWLVFDRTGSSLLTGVVYALSFLPDALGGPLLAGLADRMPHRDLMIRCDVGCAVLVAVMAIPGVPFAVLCVLLVAVQLLIAPFGAARAALLPEVLPDDRYLVANAVGNMTRQFAQVLGFAVGGGLATVLGTSTTLVIDAATFAISAAVLRTFLGQREPAAQPAIRPSPLRSAAAGLQLIAGDPRLRILVAFALLCGAYVVPEGLAAPYAHDLGRGAGAVGLLMAAQPAGAVLGAVLLARWVPPGSRGRWMGPLALLSCAPLVGCATTPSLTMTLALWALSGVGTAYQLVANAAFMIAVPASGRGQAFGLVQAAILVVQGLAILLAGAAAQLMAPATVVTLAGGLGAGIAGILARSYVRVPAATASRVPA